MLKLEYNLVGKGTNIISFLSTLQDIQNIYSDELSIGCSYLSKNDNSKAMISIIFNKICVDYDIVLNWDINLTDIHKMMFDNCDIVNLIINDRVISYNISTEEHVSLMKLLENEFARYDRDPNNKIHISNRTYKNDVMNSITIPFNKYIDKKENPVQFNMDFWITSTGIFVYNKIGE